MDEDLYDQLTGSDRTKTYPPSEIELFDLLDNSLSSNSPLFKRIIFGNNVEKSSKSSVATSAKTINSSHNVDEDLDNLPSEYRPSQRGKTCGHIFEKGEGIYRCRDCALDSTCVFCDLCFHASNHEGHDTLFALSSSGGGCCDCGDREAWKVHIDCKYHSPDTSTSLVDDQAMMDRLPLELLSSMEQTITTILEFIIQTFSYSYWKPFTPESPSYFQSVNMTGNLQGDEAYSVILWNDEVHSFQDVIEVVSMALNFSSDQGMQVAKTVDQEGRDVIYTGIDKTRLLQVATLINRIKLDVTVQPHHFTLQENVASQCVKWMYSLLSRLTSMQTKINDITYEAAKPVMRKAICNIFFNPPILVVQVLPDRYHLGPEGPPNMNEIAESPCRLDYLLFYHVKLWKSLRKLMHELLIATVVVSGDEYKRLFAKRFALLYTKLAENSVTIDRETELSVIYLSVQLFTVPSIARYLALDSTIISDILFFLYSLFRANNNDNRVTRLQLRAVEKGITKEIVATRRIFAPTIMAASSYILKFNKLYGHVMHDLGYLLSNRAVRMELFEPNRTYIDLFSFLKLFALGQGINPQTRAIAQHVEFEDDEWVNAFNLSLKLSQVIPYVAGCFAPFNKTNPILLDQALAETSAVLLSPSAQTRDLDSVKWTVIDNDADGFGSYVIPRYQVSTLPVSLHHPIHWFLALLISYVPISMKCNSSRLVQILTRNLPELGDSYYSVLIGFDTVTVSKAEMLSLLFEAPLRTMAMLSQIEVGLWVRNGYALRAQAYHYEELELREDGHDQDILLLQTAAVTLGPERFLIQALHRFELWDWLIVRQNVIISTGFDQYKLGFIAEEFLRLLIIVITERQMCCMGIGEVTAESEIRREMMHHLGAAANGLTHSAVIQKLPDRLMDPHALNDGLHRPLQKPLDDILTEVANFKYPKGVSDQGVYQLKSVYYKQIDPWFWHYSRHQRHKIEEILREKAACAKQVRYFTLPRIVPVPSDSPFSDLWRITTSRIFLKLILNSLQMTTLPQVVGSLARPFRNEDIVASALHLIIIALSDARSRTIFSEKASTEEFPALAPVGHTVTLIAQLLSLAEWCGIGTTTKSNRYISWQQADFKGQLGRLEHIIEQFSMTIPTIIQKWRDSIQSKAGSVSNGTEPRDDASGKDNEQISKNTRKATTGKDVFATLQADMAKQGQRFVENNISDWQGIEDNPKTEANRSPPAQEEERIYEYPKDVCIRCLNSAASRLHGTLCLLQKSAVLQQVDFSNIDNVIEVMTKVGTSLDIPSLTPSKSDIVSPAAVLSTGSNQFQEAGFFMSTCGHLMHVDCFRMYTQSIRDRHASTHTRRLEPEDLSQREFLCPMCKTLGNCLLPIAFPEAKEKVLWSYDQVVDGDSFESTLQQWWSMHQDTITKSLNADPLQEGLPGHALSWLSSARAASSSLLSKLADMLRYSKSESSQLDLQEALAKHYFEQLVPHVWNALYDPMEEPDLDASDLMLLPETIYYTIASLELASRGLPPPQLDGFRIDKYGNKRIYRIGVIDALTSKQIMLLRQLCSTHDMIAEFMAQKHGSAQNPAVMARRVLHALLEGVLGSYKWNDESGWEDQNGRDFEKEVWTATHGGFWHVVGMSLFLKSSDIFGEDHRIMVGLAYIREIVRCCFVVNNSIVIKNQQWTQDERLISLATPKHNYSSINIETTSRHVLKVLSWLARFILEDKFGKDQASRLEQVNTSVIISMLERIMLVFLRRTAILLDARFKLKPAGGSNGFGFDKVDISQLSDEDLDEDTFESGEKTETERLLLYLGLPSLPDVFALVAKGLDDPNNLVHKLVKGWCMQIKQSFALRKSSNIMDEDQLETGNVESLNFENITQVSGSSSSASIKSTVTTTMEQHTNIVEDPLSNVPDMNLPSPLPFTLVQLPIQGDILLQESFKRVCPRCKTVPSEPAICLLCGTTVCVQAMCCMDDENRGECNLHIVECGRNVGVFFVMRRAAIMVMRLNNRGCMLNSPYLDAHGEEDPGFRRGRPVYLNTRRYDEVKKMFINHDLTTHISKRLHQIDDAVSNC